MEDGQREEPAGGPGRALAAEEAADLVARAVQLAESAADMSDEEFTDAAGSSEEEHSESDDGSDSGDGSEDSSDLDDADPASPTAAAAPAPDAATVAAEARAAAAAAVPGGASGSEALGSGASPVLRAAAAAVDAAAAAGVEREGREWDLQMAARAAIAEAHVQDGKLDKAINEYSALLFRSGMAAASDAPAGGGAAAAARRRRAAVLLARSAAYAAFSEQLRSIPAAQSESRALYAPDPCHLAGMGLRDAEAAEGADPDNPEAFLHKGHALRLLERYGQAEEAYRSGLQLQPTHEQLQAALHELQSQHAGDAARSGGGGNGGDAEDEPAAGSGGAAAAATAGQAGSRKLQLSDDAECVLCMRLLYEPVTTPCGHSFCKTCFTRAMDHASRCPQCRTVLHAGRELNVTITLKNLLERSFPEEYEQRRQEERGAAAAAPDTNAPLPMFVMSALLPGERMALNIFEPRYRLMVRRCMEGNRAFGMGTVNRQHQLAEVACEAEITECQPLPDGRYYIEVLGRRRFRPVETWEQDGYRVARPEYLEDEAPAEGSAEAASLAQAAADVEAAADAWVERLRAMAQARRGVAELLVRAGDKPSGATATPEKLSFWVANLICPVLDMEAALKQRLITTRSTLERLQTERQILQQLNNTSTQGCSIM